MADDLISLATRHKTDKWGGHRYAQHYDRHFAPLCDRPLKLLEIGIGGYGVPTAGGESLRMWRDYFPHAEIFGLDVVDKTAHDEARIRTYVGDQSDPAVLERLHRDSGGFDIVIDDGSHFCAHVVASFTTLFPLMNDGGIYAVEDLQTSYWEVFGGGSDPGNRGGSAMEYLKGLADGLNHVEYAIENYQPTIFDKLVVSIHFYHNLCFVYKGLTTRAAMFSIEVPAAAAAPVTAARAGTRSLDGAQAGLFRPTALGYPVRMTGRADPRLLRRLAACLMLGGCVLRADLAAAQGVPPFIGFGPLPSFAWPQPAGIDESRWTGSYARMSTGFAVASSNRFGSHAGPTVGFEGGRMWQDGRFVYGVVGGFDYLAPAGGNLMPGFGGLAYSRDFAGALQVQVGTLLTPDVLLYAKAGAWAVHERLRFGATSSAQPFAREDVAVRPDARVGVEWAVTDRLSVAVEAGVTGSGLRR